MSTTPENQILSPEGMANQETHQAVDIWLNERRKTQEDLFKAGQIIGQQAATINEKDSTIRELQRQLDEARDFERIFTKVAREEVDKHIARVTVVTNEWVAKMMRGSGKGTP